MSGVSIVIPVFNEERSIAATIREIEKSVASLDVETEIIVVDDGSTDRTLEMLEGLPIRLLQHDKNIGYGGSLKTGIRNSKYDTIVITDADGTYPNNRILELIENFKLNALDMLVGARTGDNVHIPLIRKPAKWLLNRLANYLAGIKIPDLNSGLRVMKNESITPFFRILPDGFSFTTTITLAMLANGYLVKYVPVDYNKREGKSKIKPIRDTLGFIQLIIRTAMYFNPLKIFIPLSLSLFFVAFLVLFGSWYLTGQFMDVSFGVIIMASIIVMALGMIADLIDKRI